MVETLPKPDVKEGKATTIAGLPIQKASEKLDRVSMLVYGDPGVGKTWLAGSANDVDFMKPVLFVDCEGGTKTLRNTQPDIEVVRVQTLFDKGGRIRKSAWEYLTDGIYEDLKLDATRYKTIIIDSLTEASNLAMQDSIDLSVAESARDRDPDVPEQRDYLKTLSKVRKWIRGMRDLHTHIIFTALVREETNDQGSVTKVVPALAGKKLSNEAPAWVDLVMYLYTQTVKQDNKNVIVRKGLSQPSGKHYAKDRSDKLPQVLDNPTMANITELALDK